VPGAWARKLDPFMTGVLYCHAIAACHEVADVLRMTRWTELAERWLTTVPAEVTFGAMCAVHRAQLQLLRGAWDQAEAAALRVAAMPPVPASGSPRPTGRSATRPPPTRSGHGRRQSMSGWGRAGRCASCPTA
jgi:hypothetical protein